MLVEREAVAPVIDLLKEHSFYREKHKKIFAAIVHMYMQDQAIDLVTLSEELKRRKILSFSNFSLEDKS